jgi:hypothetical protein
MPDITTNPICYSPLPLVLKDHEVAALLRTKLATLRAWHSQWHRKNGFPRPISGMSPLRWSGPQLEAWLQPKSGIIGDHEVTRLDKLMNRYVPKAA